MKHNLKLQDQIEKLIEEAVEKKKHEKEFSFVCFYNEETREYHDFFVCGSELDTAVTTTESLTPQEMVKVAKIMEETGSKKVWGHSHVRMACSPSAQDISTMKSGVEYGLIVNLFCEFTEMYWDNKELYINKFTGGNRNAKYKVRTQYGRGYGNQTTYGRGVQSYYNSWDDAEWGYSNGYGGYYGSSYGNNNGRKSKKRKGRRFGR